MSLQIPTFDELKKEYAELWNTAKYENNAHNNEVYTLVKDQLTPFALEQYHAVESKYGVPWWFTCAVHLMEASGDFKKHLHNGDPLSHPTVNVPVDRPDKHWRSPPGTWVQSACDAIRYMKYDLVDHWTVERALYLGEKYNGFKSRLLHHINTPYLWSYSKHYTKGKFVRDNVWSNEAVSRQPGLAIILREFVRQKNFVYNRETI